ALGPLDGQFGDRGVVRGRAVEGGGDHLTGDRALHIGDFLRTFVHEHHHQVHVRVIGGDRIGDLLHHDRLAGLGRGDDQTALALADRGHQVHDAGADLARGGLQPEPVLRVQRGQRGELRARGGLGQRHAVDRVQSYQRVVLAVAAFAFAGLAHRAGDRVPAAQAVLLHLAQGDVDVIGAGQVAAGTHESVVVQHIEDSRHRQQDVVLGDDDLFLDLRTRAALAVPGAVPATTTTPGAFLIVAVAAAGAAGVVLLIVVRAAPFGQLDIVQRGVATTGLAFAASCRGLALLRLATTVAASTMTAVAAGSTTAIAAAVLGLLLRLGAALTAGAVTTGRPGRTGGLGTGLLSGLACGQVGQV